MPERLRIFHFNHFFPLKIRKSMKQMHMCNKREKPYIEKYNFLSHTKHNSIHPHTKWWCLPLVLNIHYAKLCFLFINIYKTHKIKITTMWCAIFAHFLVFNQFSFTLYTLTCNINFFSLNFKFFFNLCPIYKYIYT